VSLLSAEGCYNRLDGQHSSLRTHHSVFFKGRETHWGHDTAFISDKFERFKINHCMGLKIFEWFIDKWYWNVTFLIDFGKWSAKSKNPHNFLFSVLSRFSQMSNPHSSLYSRKFSAKREVPHWRHSVGVFTIRSLKWFTEMMFGISTVRHFMEQEYSCIWFKKIFVTIAYISSCCSFISYYNTVQNTDGDV
jgi:hypothetical protein